MLHQISETLPSFSRPKPFLQNLRIFLKPNRFVEVSRSCQIFPIIHVHRNQFKQFKVVS